MKNAKDPSPIVMSVKQLIDAARRIETDPKFATIRAVSEDVTNAAAEITGEEDKTQHQQAETQRHEGGTTLASWIAGSLEKMLPALNGIFAAWAAIASATSRRP